MEKYSTVSKTKWNDKTPSKVPPNRSAIREKYQGELICISHCAILRDHIAAMFIIQSHCLQVT